MEIRARGAGKGPLIFWRRRKLQTRYRRETGYHERKRDTIRGNGIPRTTRGNGAPSLACLGTLIVLHRWVERNISSIWTKRTHRRGEGDRTIIYGLSSKRQNVKGSEN